MLTKPVRSMLAIILCTLLARRPIMSHAERSEVNREWNLTVSLNYFGFVNRAELLGCLKWKRISINASINNSVDSAKKIKTSDFFVCLSVWCCLATVTCRRMKMLLSNQIARVYLLNRRILGGGRL